MTGEVPSVTVNCHCSLF